MQGYASTKLAKATVSNNLNQVVQGLVSFTPSLTAAVVKGQQAELQSSVKVGWDGKVANLHEQQLVTISGGVREVQTIAVTATKADLGGNFVVKYGAASSAELNGAFTAVGDASAKAMATALSAVTGIGDVTVTATQYSNGAVYYITFDGIAGNAGDQDLFTIDVAKLTGTGAKAVVEERQQGAALGGTFTLSATAGGVTKKTADLAAGATAAQVAAALNALANIASASVETTAVNRGLVYNVTFAGTPGDLAMMTFDAAKLTGGTPRIAVTEALKGIKDNIFYAKSSPGGQQVAPIKYFAKDAALNEIECTMSITVKETDDCASSPCQNGGACTDKMGDYSCACVAGWAGAADRSVAGNCQIDVNECLSSVLSCSSHTSGVQTHWSNSKAGNDAYNAQCNGPCENGASCVESSANASVAVNAYRCDCHNGFSGTNCDTLDECAANLNSCGLSSAAPAAKVTAPNGVQVFVCGRDWKCVDPDKTITDDYYCECPSCNDTLFSTPQVAAFGTYFGSHPGMARHVANQVRPPPPCSPPCSAPLSSSCSPPCSTPCSQVGALGDKSICVDPNNPVVGCTDSTSFNYNSLATVNGGCIAKVTGCMDTSAANFNAGANYDDGSQCKKVGYSENDECKVGAADPCRASKHRLCAAGTGSAKGLPCTWTRDWDGDGAYDSTCNYQSASGNRRLLEVEDGGAHIEQEHGLVWLERRALAAKSEKRAKSQKYSEKQELKKFMSKAEFKAAVEKSLEDNGEQKAKAAFAFTKYEQKLELAIEIEGADEADFADTVDGLGAREQFADAAKEALGSGVSAAVFKSVSKGAKGVNVTFTATASEDKYSVVNSASLVDTFVTKIASQKTSRQAAGKKVFGSRAGSPAGVKKAAAFQKPKPEKQGEVKHKRDSIERQKFGRRLADESESDMRRRLRAGEAEIVSISVAATTVVEYEYVASTDASCKRDDVFRCSQGLKCVDPNKFWPDDYVCSCSWNTASCGNEIVYTEPTTSSAVSNYQLTKLAQPGTPVRAHLERSITP